MPVLAADDLFKCALELFNAVIDALTNEAPGGMVPYAAIWPGAPSFDCVPAMYVHAGGPSVGDTYPLQPPLQPMQRIAYAEMVNLVPLTITVLRCAPVMEQDGQTLRLPDDKQLSSAAREVYGDVWAIWNHLKNEHRDGRLFQVPSGRREFAFDPVVSIPTSGGAAGWQIPVRVQLGGYPTPEAS